MIGAITVTRTPGRETDKGDFEFKVTVPSAQVWAFLAAFPGFELSLRLPEAKSLNPESRHSGMDYRNPDCRDADSQEAQAPTQALEMQGWDSAQVGISLAPNADVINLCRLPTFQEYALSQQKASASEVENIDLFALQYALSLTQKDIVSITAEDYVEKLMKPFNEWMRRKP